MIALVLAAALHAAPLFAEGELFKIYKNYQKAIAKGDVASAKFFLSNGRRAQLANKSNEAALAEMDVIEPKEHLRLHDEIIDGDDATLIVAADVAENKSTGRIELVREQGTWKILSEMWDLGGAPEDQPPPDPEDRVRQPENDTQRAALRKLREMGYPRPSANFLVSSAVEGKADVVKTFLEAGYSPNTKDNGLPAIVAAAMYNHPDVVKVLIDAGADVNATDDVNTTALMRIATQCDATPTIRLLLKGGARTDVKSAGGATAADLAGYANCAENVAAMKGATKR